MQWCSCCPAPACWGVLVATARESAAQQLHIELAALPDEQQRRRLATLLSVDEALCRRPASCDPGAYRGPVS